MWSLSGSPGKKTKYVADYIGRIINHDDWMLNPLVFGELDALWGPHTVDRFADGYNSLIPRFNSRY